MIVNVVLADTGQQDPFGKTHLLGAGWSTTQTGPNGLVPDQAVAVFLEVPWDRCNREMAFSLQLLDADGHPVLLPSAESAEPSAALQVESVITATPPAGAPNGTPGTASFFVALVGGLPLEPGQRYSWQVRLDGESDDSWRASFFVQRQQTTTRFGG